MHTVKYYSALEKNESLSFATTKMNLEEIRLTGAGQSQRTSTVEVHLYERSKMVKFIEAESI